MSTQATDPLAAARQSLADLVAAIHRNTEAMSCCPAGLPELAEVETHDGIGTRWYHLGYVRAQVHAAGTQAVARDKWVFTHRLPERLLPDVVRLLRGTGVAFSVRVYQVEPPNRFGVRFVRIRVEIC